MALRRNQAVIVINNLLHTEAEYGDGYTDQTLFDTVVPVRRDNKEWYTITETKRDVPGCDGESIKDREVVSRYGKLTLRMPFIPAVAHAFLAAKNGIAEAPVGDIHKSRITPFGEYRIPSFAVAIGYAGEGAEDIFATEILKGVFVSDVQIDIPRRDAVELIVNLVFKADVTETTGVNFPLCTEGLTVFSKHAKLTYAGTDYSALLQNGTLSYTGSNRPILDDSAYEGVGIDISKAERNDIREESFKLQVPVHKGHPLHTDAKNLAHRSFTVQLGTDVENVKLIVRDAVVEFDGDQGIRFNLEQGRAETALQWTPVKARIAGVEHLVDIESTLPGIDGTFLSPEPAPPVPVVP